MELCYMFGLNYKFNSLNVNIILYILYNIYFHMSINAMKLLIFDRVPYMATQ